MKLLSQVARREEAPPQHLRPLPGGVRGKAGGYDPGGTGGDGRGEGGIGSMKNTRRGSPGG